MSIEKKIIYILKTIHFMKTIKSRSLRKKRVSLLRKETLIIRDRFEVLGHKRSLIGFKRPWRLTTIMHLDYNYNVKRWGWWRFFYRLLFRDKNLQTVKLSRITFSRLRQPIYLSWERTLSFKATYKFESTSLDPDTGIESKQVYYIYFYLNKYFFRLIGRKRI